MIITRAVQCDHCKKCVPLDYIFYPQGWYIVTKETLTVNTREQQKNIKHFCSDECIAHNYGDLDSPEWRTYDHRHNAG